MRKTFEIHLNALGVVEDLSDEQAGKLFKAIKAHHFNEEITLDPITKVALHPFKMQFERDMEKYLGVVERNKINGSKGGRPKKQSKPKKPSGLSGNPKKPRKADNDSVNDNDNDSDNVNGKENTIKPDFFPQQTWDDFLEFRKSIKSPMSEKAQALLANKIISYFNDGYNVVAMVEASIMNGWKSIYPDKNDSKQRSLSMATEKTINSLTNLELN